MSHLIKTGSKATLKSHKYRGRSNTFKICTWALTIKNNDNSYTAYQEDLLKVVKKFPYDLSDINYEIDGSKRRKLHIHATFRAPSNLSFKTLMQKNWHIYAKKQYSVGWHSYSEKDQKDVNILQKHTAIHFVYPEDL